ncbi:MAG TPA: DUF1570 domain-containing protein [Pirellulales bacterium]|nr:DUF1570 domain-containing protein [Pirellulales bacterium]
MRGLACFFALLLAVPGVADAVEHVVLKREGREISIAGRLLVTAEDNGMLVLTPDGRLWSVLPEEIVEHSNDGKPMTPLSSDELGEQLLKELPAGFETYATQHYLICYNTSRVYAHWCGALFERLYKAFTNFWSRKGFELHEPEFPLVAMVFADRQSYDAFSRRELGDGAPAVIGYYNLRSNQMTMYDLTGLEALRSPGNRRGSPKQISQMLARPEAERMVATVIHEATHQIAFNCGLQTRFADIPLWISEGIAIYFETPDLGRSNGWSTVGAVNRGRLAGFRDYLSRGRPADSLVTLISSHERLRDPRRNADAYAEAWALNFFLIRQREKQYLAYLKMLSEKDPLLPDDPETRLLEFNQAFGNLEQLDAEFLRHMSKVR